MMEVKPNVNIKETMWKGKVYHENGRDLVDYKYI